LVLGIKKVIVIFRKYFLILVLGIKKVIVIFRNLCVSVCELLKV